MFKFSKYKMVKSTIGISREERNTEMLQNEH